MIFIFCVYTLSIIYILKMNVKKFNVKNALYFTLIITTMTISIFFANKGEGLWEGIHHYVPSFGSSEAMFYFVTIVQYLSFIYTCYHLSEEVMDDHRKLLITSSALLFSVMHILLYYTLNFDYKNFSKSFHISMLMGMFSTIILILSYEIFERYLIWSSTLSLLCSIYLISFTLRVKNNSK